MFNLTSKQENSDKIRWQWDNRFLPKKLTKGKNNNNIQSWQKYREMGTLTIELIKLHLAFLEGNLAWYLRNLKYVLTFQLSDSTSGDTA